MGLPLPRLGVKRKGITLYSNFFIHLLADTLYIYHYVYLYLYPYTYTYVYPLPYTLTQG